MNLKNEEPTNKATEDEEVVHGDPQLSGDDLGYAAAETEEDDLMVLLAQERLKNEDLIDQLQRERAQLINYRRRMEQEQERVQARAIENTLRKLLPIADDLHRAIKSLPADTEGNSWAEGFRLIETNLRRALEAEGVTPMESVGQPFDPSRHEAVVFDENTNGDHMVVEEFQRGYLIDDKVLRPAMVKVGSLSTDKTDEQSEPNGNR